MKAIWFAKYRKIIQDGRCRGCDTRLTKGDDVLSFKEEEHLTSSAMTA